MWGERFRLPDAAEMIGLTYPVLKGWRERGVIETVGRDTTRPGYPHFVPLIEIARLALAAQMQRLSKVAFDARWNPGPFLRALRKGVSDKELQQIAAGLRWQDPAGRGTGVDASVFRQDDEVDDGSRDVLMIVDPSNDEGDQKGKAVRLVSVERFRRGLDTHLSREDAYVILNASAVFRRFLARRNEIKDRRPEGLVVTRDGWRLTEGWVPEKRNR